MSTTRTRKPKSETPETPETPTPSETPTPETPETPATPETPTPVSSVADFTPDDGKIADRNAYTEAFANLTSALITFVVGSVGVGEGSRLGNLATLDLRESVIRLDNAAPDWAGKTSGYTEAIGAFLDRWASSNTYTGLDGQPKPITGDQVKAYRSRISSYGSDHQTLHRRMAEYEARTNSKATATLAEVTAAWDNADAGTALPPAVKANEKAQLAKQVGFKSGKAFSNFDPDLNVATVNGRKPKPGSDAGSGDDNASAATPGKSWVACRKQISEGVGGFLPLPDMADEVHHVVTAAILAIAGPIGEKITPTGKLPANGKGRKQAIETLAKAGEALQVMATALEGKTEGVTKESLTGLLWTEKAKA